MRTFTFTDGKEISVNEVYEVLKNVTGFEKDAEKIAEIKGEVKKIVLDISLAQKELSWNPTTELDEGIKKTWEWLNSK